MCHGDVSLSILARTPSTHLHGLRMERETSPCFSIKLYISLLTEMERLD